jgi:hypothetical protein
MSRAAPEIGLAPARVASSRDRKEDSKSLTGKYRGASLSPRTCLSLLAERYASGLLMPLTCSQCGQRSIDPLGWNGPRLPLCGRCADWETEV